MQTSATPIQGIASTGVIIYEYEQEGDECAGRTLLKAFTDINMQSSLLTPPQPLQDIPSPSVIIALKPPEFLRPSNQPLISGKKNDNVPTDLLSRVE